MAWGLCGDSEVQNHSQLKQKLLKYCYYTLKQLADIYEPIIVLYAFSVESCMNLNFICMWESETIISTD